MSVDRSKDAIQTGSRRNLPLAALLLVLCAAADLFVLRASLIQRTPSPNQFRRGYFETIGDEVVIAADARIDIGMLPTFLLTPAGELGVPPGVTAVMPLVDGARFQLASFDSARSPYVVIGVQSPAPEPAGAGPSSGGEASLTAARRLDVVDGHLALAPWDAKRSWRDDWSSLSRMRETCVAEGEPAGVTVGVTDRELVIELGRCAWREPMASSNPMLLAAVSGPDWSTVAKQPGWQGSRSAALPALVLVTVKVAVMAWALGIGAAMATSFSLAAGAVALPLAAMLMWPALAGLALVAAVVRIGAYAVPWVPARARRPLGWILGILVLGFVGWKMVAPRQIHPYVRSQPRGTLDPTCTVVGYSTVKGEGLRREAGGIRSTLDRDCAACRESTAGVFAGGEGLAWAKDSYCRQDGLSRGSVIFLGGANDDLLSGTLAVARLMVVSQQGIEPWHRDQTQAAAASLARIDGQLADLDGLIDCARGRGSEFVFLHDFLVTDMLRGRDRDRAEMLRRRRETVKAAGGEFVDLLEVFGDRAGVSWFNDYVHPSLIGHREFSRTACGHLMNRS